MVKNVLEGHASVSHVSVGINFVLLQHKTFIMSVYHIVNYHLFLSFIALCSPACTLTTDTCVALNTCKCGSADPCGATLSNRCLNSVCVCGTSALCTAGTTTPVCLDQIGQTPGSSNTVATCKVSS